jgi:hypothetical protein
MKYKCDKFKFSQILSCYLDYGLDISIECNCWVKFTFFLCNEFLPSSKEN